MESIYSGINWNHALPTIISYVLEDEAATRYANPQLWNDKSPSQVKTPEHFRKWLIAHYVNMHYPDLYVDQIKNYTWTNISQSNILDALIKYLSLLDKAEQAIKYNPHSSDEDIESQLQILHRDSIKYWNQSTPNWASDLYFEQERYKATIQENENAKEAFKRIKPKLQNIQNDAKEKEKLYGKSQSHTSKFYSMQHQQQQSMAIQVNNRSQHEHHDNEGLSRSSTIRSRHRSHHHQHHQHHRNHRQHHHRSHSRSRSRSKTPFREFTDRNRYGSRRRHRSSFQHQSQSRPPYSRSRSPYHYSRSRSHHRSPSRSTSSRSPSYQHNSNTNNNNTMLLFT